MADEKDGLNQQSRVPRGLRSSRRYDEDYEAWAEAEAAQVEEDERRAAEEAVENRSNAIEVMTDWFHSQFEDPQNQTPYDGEGGYTYMWGGPFEAMDVLYGNFAGEYDEEWIQAAANEVESDGIVEWAPSSSGDYYEHPDPDDDDPLETTATVTREDVLAQIESLKGQLAELPIRSGQIGHNRPPEEIGAPPYDERDRAEIQVLLNEAEKEISSQTPDEEKLARSTSRLEEFAITAIKYAGSKVDLAINESIKKGVPIFLTYLTFGEKLQTLISSIGSFFGF